MKKTILVLDDGTFWEGFSWGADGEASGEAVVFTGVIGYQEAMTDPANAGRIVVMAYPHIGNTGIVDDGWMSERAWTPAIVVKEPSRLFSSHLARQDLRSFALEQKVLVLAGVDTQGIARHIRDGGCRRAAVSTECADPAALARRIASAEPQGPRATAVGCRAVQRRATSPEQPAHVVALDWGISRDLVRTLQAAGCAVTRVPWDASAESVLALEPDGVVLPGGPEDPAFPAMVAPVVSALAERKPLLAVGFGFQVLCAALGGRLVPLASGHFGLNQAVRNLGTRACLSTEQYHRWTVERGSLPDPVEVTHENINDATIEGIALRGLPVLAVQYSPAAGDPVIAGWRSTLNA